MANKYPLVSNSATKTIQEIGLGDTLQTDNLLVGNLVSGNLTTGTGEANILGNLHVGGNLTVDGSINADLGNVIVENLTVEGKTNLNSVGNVTITGGSNNYVLRTDGSGNLTWANIQSEIANAAGANTYVQFNNNNLFGASANFTYNSATNTLNIQGNANIATLNPTVSNLGPVANVHITGGSSGYVLATNGSGNLSWVAIDPSVSGDGGNASSSVLLLASLNGGNAVAA